MRAELVVIGNEVLTGFTVNTNAAFIGQQLMKAGYLLTQQTVVPDHADLLSEVLSQALERSDLVITTGGLGATIDDITRQVAAKLFGSDFTYDETVADDIARRYKKYLSIMQDTLKDQATVPSKAKVLLNPVGSAPGFIFQEDNKTLVMLPGVPNEMKPMLTEQVIPFMLEAFPLSVRSYRKTLHLFELPELSVDPLLRELDEKYPEVNFAIYPALGTLTLHLTTEAESEEKAMRILDEPYCEIETRFATNCFHSESGILEEAVHHMFIENQWTLSVAESCTGGSVSSRLTQLPGASEYFLGSVVSYANDVKTKILGVPEQLIQEKGAVSQEVVEKMVEGVIRITGSDFAVAVSGIAGPSGGTPEKPVGTVWCAVCRKGETPHTWKISARGTREMIIFRSVNSLFSNLLLYAKETSLL